MPGQIANRMTAILKYPGAKWRVAQWIINFFPEHHSYIEPYFGSGAVLFNKPRSNIETVNDMDGEVVNFFECIKKDPERLADEVYMTPYSRAVYKDAYTICPADSFERARNFFIRCNMGHGFRTTGEKVGWKNDVKGRERAYAAAAWAKAPDTIISAAERLRGVQIDNRPANEFIPRFNDPRVLVYADPPYLLNTRHGKQYRHEMSEDDHAELLEILKAHQGAVILSGYESELYNSKLQGWHKEYKDNHTQTASKKQEVLWMNFEPENRMMEMDEC